MKRRELLAAGAVALAGCAGEQADCGPGAGPAQRFDWKLVTTWPPNFPGLGTGVLQRAEMIGAASGGRLRIKVYAAGELVPAFEVFDTVSSGTAEMGHGSAYYWKGKAEAVTPAAQRSSHSSGSYLMITQTVAWCHHFDPNCRPATTNTASSLPVPKAGWSRSMTRPTPSR